MLIDFLPFFIFVNVLTFVVYVFDKYAARRRRRRVSEKALHFLSFIGGWVGALIAQKLLRHKTIKQPFHFIFWCTVFINSSLIITYPLIVLLL